MISETIRIGKDAAANHKTIGFRVGLVQFEGLGAVFDVAIEDEFGGRADLVA